MVPTGARAKAWCLLIHADASFSLCVGSLVDGVVCKPLVTSATTTSISDYSLGLRGTLSGAARVTKAGGASSAMHGTFLVDATVSPAVVSAARTATLALPVGRRWLTPD